MDSASPAHMGTHDDDTNLATWLAEQSIVAPGTVSLSTGDILFAQGSDADAVYLLTDGELSVVIAADDDDPAAQTTIDRLQPGTLIGELGSHTGLPHAATVVALTPARLSRFDAAALARLEARRPDLHTSLARQSAIRWEKVHLAARLLRLFGPKLDLPLLQMLQARLTWKVLSNGETVCHQGEPSDGMYLIVSGRVRFLVHDADGTERSVGGAEAGETVGEYSLISPDVRSATVQATRETHLVHFTPALFDELLAVRPALLQPITRIIVERRQRALGLRPATVRVRTTMALVPANGSADIHPFVDQLMQPLARHGTVLRLNAPAFDERFGRTGAAQTPIDHPRARAIAEWFGTQEELYDFIIFEPDPTWTPWTQRCLNQADRIVIIGRSGDPVTPGPIEQRLQALSAHAQTYLALWHSPGTEHPVGTAAWLAPRNVTNHFHVRDGDAAHFARLARQLIDRAVSLVLSGGGARGFVHLGIMRAMNELGIPVDFVGGTSHGALLGAARARDLSVDHIMALCAELTDPRALFDRTLPLVALNASHKLSRVMRKAYEDWAIEDLWIPYFAIGANLSTAAEVVYRRGLVRDAVRRSVSIPGVFSPLNDDGNLIVDGGMMNNFPADVMREVAQSPRIIGVMLGQHAGYKATYDIGDGISGWQVLWRRLNPLQRNLRVPGITSTLMVTLMVNNTQRELQNARLVDLLINPRVRGYGMLDFDAYAEIAEYGYEMSYETLREWHARQPDLNP